MPLIAADTWDNVERIVAVGDVHGDYDQFTTILRQAEVIDENDDWSGGKTHLVQTGDVPDRGPDTRRILDLLMKIEKQARRAKGYVHCLIGNHEAMNLYGDLRYVVPGEFASFDDLEKESDRKRALQAYLKENEGASEAEWAKEHPPGWFGHRKAFDPTGPYGRWIAGHNVIIRINDIIFLHAGIGPKYADMKLSDINSLARPELKTFAGLPGGLIDDGEGPLWYRGLSQGDEAVEQAHFDQFLDLNRASRMVVGHTVTAGAVFPRFGSKLLMIDVGLAEAYGGRQACLIIENGEYSAMHRGRKLDLPVNAGDSLMSYLREAAELEPKPSPLAVLLRDLQAKEPVPR